MRVGKRTRSRILIDGQSKVTGRYDVDFSAGFPGFSRGIIVDVFQIAGI